MTSAFGTGGALPDSVSLRDFLASAGSLTHAERLTIVDQALVLLRDNYVHLTLKTAMHAVDPVQRLSVLRARLQRRTDATMGPEAAFHAEVSAAFHSLRDLHTAYLLPEPFAGQLAYLPFTVERCVDGGTERFLVTATVAGFDVPGFVPGVQVTHWSGTPVARAVAIHGDRCAGSNDAARAARGVESLTLRPLRSLLPPDEEWVTVTYAGDDDVVHELRAPWLVAANLPLPADTGTPSATAASMGLDLQADELGRARTLLYVPEVAAQARSERPVALMEEAAGPGGEVPTSMPGVFRARSVVTGAGTFGHLRVFTFHVADPEAFVTELVRLLQLLPQAGLVLDVRGNGGGHIFAAEYALQTLTPREVVPEPVQLACTPLNLRLCRANATGGEHGVDLGPWLPSMEQALETGAAYSSPVAMTPSGRVNATGQRYSGPVVLVTDARCYSATDIFAAGFQDHGIGPVLGVDDNTGAGGANVWTHALLRSLLPDDGAGPPSPYADLPRGADLRVAVRRTLRVGALAGTPVEDLGVRPDVTHVLTRRDVLDGNRDLLEAAGALLAQGTVRRLAVTCTLESDGALTVQVEVGGLDRVDVYVDGRPRTTADVVDGEHVLRVEGAGAVGEVRVDGFVDGVLVAARREPVLTSA